MLASALVLLVGAHPTDLTFVRHGETVANATGHYSGATLNEFSPRGAKEVSDLTKRLLKDARFDAIYVSPSPRALKTIAPYLKATHQKATVWPLLYECCTGKHTSEPLPTKLSYGGKIVVPKELAPYFVIVPGWDRLPAASTYAQGLRQVQDSVQEFRSRIAGGRILLVGHSGHGGHFLHSLTGRWRKVDNATEITVKLN